MKSTVALVTGGYSQESVISYKSALTIEQHLDADRFQVYKIAITPDGWYHEQDGKKWPVDRSDFSLEFQGKKIRFDVVFIGIHGTPGEDGKLQGYFDLLGLPYTSCDAATSALTFNKRFTVAVAAFAGIHTARSLHIYKSFPLSPDQILSQLRLPVFVKPNNGGSSIGMSKINAAAELPAALEKAFREDDQVLVEEFIAGREFTIGVFSHKGQITVLPITEIITKKDFFDYEAKYQPGFTEEITPAKIPDSLTQQLRETAQRVYQVFNCQGVVRMDFIYQSSEQQPYLLEINTVPGQSAMSIIPQQVRAQGMKLNDFYTLLVEEALSRKKRAAAS